MRAACCGAALVAGLSCGGGRGLGSAPSNELLVIGYDREPDTLNRFSTHILEDIESCVVEGLVTTDERMTVVPLLAVEVPTPENGGVRVRPDGGMDVTWRLRQGVRWHDGIPLSSADIKFTVDALHDPAYKPESTDGFDRIASVDTPDSLTAVVHYKEVYAAYALQFVRGLFPRHVLEGRDIDRATDYNRNPMGTGPYRVAEWRTGEFILLERVPDYWRGTEYPRIRRLLFKFVPHTNTRMTQLRSGEVHVVGLVPWDKFREISGLPGIAVHRMQGNGYEHITLNERHFPAFADLRVRRAIAHAINRELIASTILDGLASVTNGPIQPLSWAYTDSVTTYAFDPPAARALLDSAGWRAAGSGVRTKNGDALAFTLITQAGDAIRESVAQTVQRQLRDVGVDMKVRLIDGTAISTMWFEGRFDAMLHWWHMSPDPELTLFFAADRTPPAGRNIDYLADDSLTRLLYASDRTVVRSQRLTLFKAIQRRIADLAPEIPLYNVTRLDAVPATLRNFRGNPTYTGIFWNVYEWEIEPAPTARN
jgi:peptide/nickel transport system substrate-binding protein